jgi:type II secretory pathway pseudopilin PulG
MKPQHASYCKYYCRPAFTLVEVVASLMLLGTLLVGILTAHRRHSEQVRGAKERLAAVAAAERLLEAWRADGVWGATSTSGTFKDNSEFAWRWTITTPSELRRVGVAKGRLEIIKRASVDERPVVAIELVTGSAVIASGQKP